MKGPNQNRALFDAITNIDDDLIDEAAAPRVLKFPDVVRKIAAVAAVLAIICTLFLQDGKESPMPFFSVYVYASETESVELTPDGTTSAVSNVISEKNPGVSSTLFPEERKQYFSIDIMYTERTIEHSEIEILYNGKSISGSKDVFRGFISKHGKIIGFTVVGTVDSTSNIEVNMYGEETLLQKYVFTVAPVENGYSVKLKESYIADIS